MASELKQGQRTKAWLRLMANVTRLSSGCWLYMRYRNTWGYGRIRVCNRKVLAHRFVYEYLKGAIPDDLRVLHKCNNPGCVNPDHLYVGTPQDNAQDMSASGRQWLQRAKAQGLRFSISKGELPHGYQRVR